MMAQLSGSCGSRFHDILRWIAMPLGFRFDTRDSASSFLRPFATRFELEGHKTGAQFSSPSQGMSCEIVQGWGLSFDYVALGSEPAQ